MPYLQNKRKKYTDKNGLRRAKVDSRNSLTEYERRTKSEAIISNILSNESFRRAKTVMIYRTVRGEVQLDSLPELAPDKSYVYPLCIDRTRMIALKPEAGRKEAWTKGAFGIPEPVLAYSEQVSPEDIDLVICPCTAFDREHRRLGMGAGYYDRYLARCTRARIVAVAFAIQEAEEVPTEPTDVDMHAVITENGVL